MTLDTKASRIKQCSAKYQRVILPRLLDTIIAALKLLATCDEREGVSLFVLDFTEAFWQIPLSPAERRFFAARLNIDGVEKFLVFLRMVQGQSEQTDRCKTEPANCFGLRHFWPCVRV